MTVLGSLSLSVTVIIVAFLAVQVWKQYRLLRLPQATGTMIRCEPVLSMTPVSPTSGGTAMAASMWTVEARYTYTVDGKVLDGKRFSQRKVGEISNRARQTDPPPERIVRLCAPYAAGSSVAVYYDPHDPQWSFIYFNPPVTDWPTLLVPVLTGLAAIVFFGLAHVAKKLG